MRTRSVLSRRRLPVGTKKSTALMNGCTRERGEGRGEVQETKRGRGSGEYLGRGSGGGGGDEGVVLKGGFRGQNGVDVEAEDRRGRVDEEVEGDRPTWRARWVHLQGGVEWGRVREGGENARVSGGRGGGAFRRTCTHEGSNASVGAPPPNAEPEEPYNVQERNEAP